MSFWVTELWSNSSWTLRKGPQLLYPKAVHLRSEFQGEVGANQHRKMAWPEMLLPEQRVADVGEAEALPRPPALQQAPRQWAIIVACVSQLALPKI